MTATHTINRQAIDAPHLRTSIPGPKSQEIHARRLATIARGAGWILPVYIDHAEGPWLIDVDGNRLLDMGSGVGVMTIGHSNPSVISAATEQLGKFTHTLFTATPYEGYVRLGELLADKTPGDFPKKSVFCNSGAEAVENAVKVARSYTGRRAVAALDHAFHGRTNLTLAMNHEAHYGTGFGPLGADVYRAPNSYPYRDGLDGQQAAQRTIDYLEQRVGVEDLAAVIAEPIQGEGGFIIPAEGYLPTLQQWACAHGVVFIADEIQSGLARTGAWFASSQLGLTPDIVLTAKGIGGGLPLAGVTGRADIMDAPAPGGLGGTFSGNPVAVAAALAVFDELEKGDYFERASQIGSRLLDGLRRLALTHPQIGDIRGLGAMVACELSVPGTNRPLRDLATAIAAEAAQEGVLLITAGADHNVIRFLPTLKTTEQHIDYAIDVIGRALDRHM